MRNEFESELARRVAERVPGKRTIGKAWVALMLCAAVFAVSAVSVSAMQAMKGADNGDMLQDQIQDQLQDGSCEDVLDESDGICDCTCDCACDCTCDCPDCPCCDDTV